jgi:hypothetical protein
VVRRALGLLAAAAVICVCLPSTTSASQSVALHATFTPEQLGHGTTVGFAFQITAAGGQVPSPLTGIEVSYPLNLGFALSELGLASCSAGTLEVFGPQGCPANSLMGYGTAIAEIQIGLETLSETVQVDIFRTPDYDGHLALLICANGATPVSAQIVFPAVVLPAPAPFGGRLDMDIPLVPSLPEGTDVAVVQFHSTLGPLHLRYHERVHGRIVDYEPKGIPLPTRCPPGGFPFLAEFRFLDGSDAFAHTTVPCPEHRGSRRRHR